MISSYLSKVCRGFKRFYPRDHYINNEQAKLILRSILTMERPRQTTAEYSIAKTDSNKLYCLGAKIRFFSELIIFF